MTTKVVVLRGAGTDFCSGADLAEVKHAMDAPILDNLSAARLLADLFLQMRRARLPIVAAVRGRSLAGGCGLATACDLIVASETAEFGYPEVHIGFVPAMVMAILRRNVSEKRAFDLISTGRVMRAQEALEAGLVNAIYPDDQFDGATAQFASRLATRSASAIGLAKSLLYHMDGMTFEAALESGAQVNAIARMTEDCRAGVEKFLKKG
jgi:methylglutaconyl-CoA hydratase